MAVAMKLSDALVEDAKPYAAAEHRSVPKQIEYWARIGKAALFETPAAQGRAEFRRPRRVAA